MKDNFKGWKSVYTFTFRQATKGLGFKVVTALIAILILVTFIIANLVMAKPDEENKIKASTIETVYILDKSELESTDYKYINPELDNEQFAHIEFILAQDQTRSEIIKTAEANSEQTLAIIISKRESGFEMEGIIPNNSSISINEAEELLDPMSSAFEANKILQTGLSESQLNSILKPIVTSFSDIGENDSEAATLVKLVAPMVFSFMLYMMLLLHGQTISKSVSTEKTSKLMETLLTSTHPYALITGKVLAITSMALLQFVTWLVAIFAGLFGGNAIAKSIYPEYENTAITIINFLKDNIGETAMTLPAVILAIIFFCIGFIFYSVIAALAGSMVSKSEDVATTQGLFQLPIIISWLISYFAPIMEKGEIVSVARYVPFTSPFIIPVDLITGNIELIEGIISLTLLLIFSLLTIILSAKIYKGLVLYTGQKLNFKTIGNILKNS
ncbi:MAG: ABC transporter permease [Eubacteriales bacterium]